MTLYIIHQSASTIEEKESLVIPSLDEEFMTTLFDEMVSLDSDMYLMHKFPFIQMTALTLPENVDEELTIAAYDEDLDRLRDIIANDFNNYEHKVIKEWGYGSDGELNDFLKYEITIPDSYLPFVEISDEGNEFSETTDFMMA